MDGSSFLASFSMDHDIKFDGGTIDTFPVSGSKVTIYPSPDHPELSSHKLKLKNIVNYGWENKFHHGELLALHKSGSYLAYGVLTPGKNVGGIRVVQRFTEERDLIKGKEIKIKDIAFSYSTENIILGVMDDFGDVYIYQIKENLKNKSLSSELLLSISSSLNTSMINDSDKEIISPRIFWCPYVPDKDESEEDSSAQVFAVSRGCGVEVYSLRTVIAVHGVGSYDRSVITNGKSKIPDFKGLITDGAFSPDSSVIALASTDGTVAFFEASKFTDSPRCLHQWQPHDGRPVSSIFFIDDHLHQTKRQYWRYMVTGAGWNTEFKLWCCESWSCLQVVNFELKSPDVTRLKVALDNSGNYMLISDIQKRNIYVLKFSRPLKGNEEKAEIVSVSEFATPYPFLSLAILEAGVKTLKDIKMESDDQSSESDTESEEEEDDCKEVTVLKFLCIQPKSLQECQITFDDAQQKAATANLSDLPSPVRVKQENIQHKSVVVKQEFVSPPRGKTNGAYCDLQKAADKITLMSPEMFEAKLVKEEPNDETGDTSIPLRGTTVNFLATRQVLAGASGTSSPSREVADILCGEDGDDELELGAEYVVTGDHDDDDDVEDDDDDDEDEDDDSVVNDEIALKKEEEEFANLDKILKKEMKSEPETDSYNELQLIKQIKSEVPAMLCMIPKVGPQLIDQPVHSGYLTIKPNLMNRSFEGPSSSDLQLNQQMGLVLKKLNDMSALIQTQRAEMQILKEELRILHSDDTKKMKSLFYDAFANQASALSESSKVDTNLLSANLKQALSAVVESEVKNLTPKIAKMTADSLSNNLAKEVPSQLMKADKSLRDAIKKMAESKHTTDAIAKALAVTLQPVLQNAFREMFLTIVVPGFDKATKALLGGIATAFNKGCREYESQLRSNINKQLDPVTRELREVIDRGIQQRDGSFDKYLKELESKMVVIVKEAVKVEVKQAFISHSSTARSLSATPTQSPAHSTAVQSVPSLQDYQANVNKLITEGRAQEAIQCSLMANNLNLVILTCERIDPSHVFHGKIPVPQPTLLSLIQQLSINLEDKTDLKLIYLQEAIVALNLNDLASIAHVKKVIVGLKKNLDICLAKTVDPKMIRALKMLQMAVQALPQN